MALSTESLAYVLFLRGNLSPSEYTVVRSWLGIETHRDWTPAKSVPFKIEYLIEFLRLQGNLTGYRLYETLIELNAHSEKTIGEVLLWISEYNNSPTQAILPCMNAQESFNFIN